MSAEWNHAMCLDCWRAANPKREACQVVDANPELCCFCGKQTYAGIYIRKNPSELQCCGAHPSFSMIHGNAARMWLLIRAFVLNETSQTSYEELKGSQSMDIPCEFLALCEFAEEMGVKLP